MSIRHFRYFIYLCNAVTCSRHIKRKCFRTSLKENVVVFMYRVANERFCSCIGIAMPDSSGVPHIHTECGVFMFIGTKVLPQPSFR